MDQRPFPSTGVYRRRRPERTVLYRALAHHFETFIQVYDDRFLDTHGPLRACVQPAVYRYLDCGIFDRGFARARCPECGHDFMIAYSCKLRCLCPSCHKKRELLWAEWVDQELLEEVPHRQVVLTVWSQTWCCDSNGIFSFRFVHGRGRLTSSFWTT